MRHLGQRLGLGGAPLCHNASKGIRCLSQSSTVAPRPPVAQRQSSIPRALADASPGAGQLGRRAGASGVTPPLVAPGCRESHSIRQLPPQFQGGSSVGWKVRSGDCRQLCMMPATSLESGAGALIISSYDWVRAGMIQNTHTFRL